MHGQAVLAVSTLLLVAPSLRANVSIVARAGDEASDLAAARSALLIHGFTAQKVQVQISCHPEANTTAAIRIIASIEGRGSAVGGAALRVRPKLGAGC